MKNKKLIKILCLSLFMSNLFCGCSKQDNVQIIEEPIEETAIETVSNDASKTIEEPKPEINIPTVKNLLLDITDNIRITYESDMYGSVIVEKVGENQHLYFTRQNGYGFSENVDEYYIDGVDYLCILCNEDGTNHIVSVSSEIEEPCFSLDSEILNFNDIEIESVEIKSKNRKINDKKCTEILLTDNKQRQYSIFKDNETDTVVNITTVDTTFTYEPIIDINISDVAQSGSTIDSEQFIKFAHDGLNILEDCNISTILKKYENN